MREAAGGERGGGGARVRGDAVEG
jgi:hypothetical protein